MTGNKIFMLKKIEMTKMTERIQSKYNIGDKVSWRSFCDIKSGTGKIFKIKLTQDRGCLYYFEYLVEYDTTGERIWVSEFDIAYQMRKEATNK